MKHGYTPEHTHSQHEPWEYHTSERSLSKTIHCMILFTCNHQNGQILRGSPGLERGVWGEGWVTLEGDSKNACDFFWGWRNVDPESMDVVNTTELDTSDEWTVWHVTWILIKQLPEERHNKSFWDIKTAQQTCTLRNVTGSSLGRREILPPGNLALHKGMKTTRSINVWETDFFHLFWNLFKR